LILDSRELVAQINSASGPGEFFLRTKVSSSLKNTGEVFLRTPGEFFKKTRLILLDDSSEFFLRTR
jgi:hypothetical protein